MSSLSTIAKVMRAHPRLSPIVMEELVVQIRVNLILEVRPISCTSLTILVRMLSEGSKMRLT